MNRATQQIAACLAAWLSAWPLAGQDPPGAPGPRAPLNVVIVEGQGAIHNIRQRLAREAVVRVEDAEGKPVAGASVAFTLPSQGAGGAFIDGGKTLVAATDAEGRAAMRGLKPNNIAGKMEIRITASSQGRTAQATLTQFNMAVESGRGGGGGGAKWIALLAAAGGAAAAGAVLGTRGSSPAAPPAPPAAPPVITVTAGPGSVGPPQ